MADESTTTATATTDDAPAATPDKGGEGGGEAYKLRQELKALKSEAKRAKELEAQLKAIEEAQLSESDKLKRRLSELEPYQAKVQEYEATLQGVFDVEVEEIAEPLRAKVDKLIPEGLPLATRLSMLKNLKAEGVFRAPEAADDARSRPNPPQIDNRRPVNGQPAGTVLKPGQIAQMSHEEYRKIRKDLLSGRIKVLG